ncbi:MAG: hypothetical protein LWY06_00260 [Firmicutes bacterium]|nr:hypothetical protein [Bacillota bacterium]
MDDQQKIGNETEQEKDLNLLVEWEDEASASELSEKDGEDDVLSISSAETSKEDDSSFEGITIRNESEEAHLLSIAGTGDPHICFGAEAFPELPEEDEFKWSDELDRAIDEALEQMSGISAPVVYSRLKRITALFSAGDITRERALFLLDEVDTYLKKQITIRVNAIPIAHEGMQKARSLLLDALYSFHESCAALRNYIKTDAEEDRVLGENLAEHGIANALEGVEEMLGAEPGEYEEE